MEYVTCLFTVAVLWLFLFAVVVPGQRAARQGGRLLVTLKVRRARARQIVAAVGGGAMVLLFALGVVLAGDVVPSANLVGFVADLVVISSFTVRGIRGLSLGFQLRERGLFTIPWNFPAFFPWRDVKYCKWTQPGGVLLVQTHRAIASIRLEPGQVDLANAVLTRFVEVRDEAGKPIRPEDVPAECLASVEPPSDDAAEPDAPRFQFGLKTLLLFAVLVSAACGWLSVRAHDARSQRQTLGAFEAFGPKATYRGGRVRTLDFSRCRVKPGDDDLVHLRDLPSLEWLDLAGTNVTDAGLVHLVRLPRLMTLNLKQTKVTPQGAEQLQKAMPGTMVWH
jgi:hypothetical protein